MEAQDLQNFVANIQCCLSQKGIKLLNKARGGQLDKCCMTEHAFQRAVWESLSCANIGRNSALFGDGNTTELLLTVTEVCHFDGVATTICYDTFGTGYAQWVDSIWEVDTVAQTTTVTQEGGLVHKYTFTDSPLVYTPPIISLPNLSTTTTNNGVDTLWLEFLDTVSTESVIFTITYANITSFEFSCFTEEQICDLVAFMNSYCGGCNTYTPLAADALPSGATKTAPTYAIKDTASTASTASGTGGNTNKNNP